MHYDNDDDNDDYYDDDYDDQDDDNDDDDDDMYLSVIEYFNFNLQSFVAAHRVLKKVPVITMLMLLVNDDYDANDDNGNCDAVDAIQ